MSEAQSNHDRIAEQLANIKIRGPRSPDDASEALWVYREAAAVLTFFEPNTLQPLGEPVEDRAEVIGQLLDDCMVVYDEQYQPGWMLRPEIRRAAIRRLSTREAIRDALNANSDRPQSLLQRIYEALLLRRLGPLAEQSLDELAAILLALDWLDDALPGLPDPDEVRLLLDRERLLKPFRMLAGDHFRGRAKELQQLQDYVGVLPPGSRAGYLARTVRERFKPQERPPLLIYGPGGVGKSTLVARFILEHATLDQAHRIPFAYLDFDRPDLLANEPMTLLVEAARQLAIQYPEVGPICAEIRAEWERLQTISDEDESTRQQSNIPLVLGIDYGWSRQMDRFRDVLKRVGAQYRPFLIVLDSFEEVQYRSRDYVNQLWELIAELRQSVPRLRTVLAGRAPIAGLPIEELDLRDFDADAAQGFLEARGIAAPLARQIIAQVGGNPLSLSLAASLLEKEPAGPAGISDLGTRTLFFLKVKENIIQGQLYQRILGHIHNEQVRRLAHPGLVLRRITPEIMLKVLAQPCDVTIRTITEAKLLFDELQREVSLVTPGDDGSLRHRSDVRRVMLDLLRQDEPVKVEEIHRQAVNYYRLQDGPLARAEEIYHRLSLGQQRRTIDERWMPGVEDYLRSAIDELPPTAQTYLASRIGVELSEEIWSAANLSDWERRIERRARDLLLQNKPDKALAVLRERSERTMGSPLPLIEIQALAQLERWEEARTLALAAIGQTPPSSRMLLDLLMLVSQVNQPIGNYDEAEEALARAKALAERFGGTLRGLEIALLRLRLASRKVAVDERYTTESAEVRAAKRKSELLLLWNNASYKELARQPRLVKDVAGELGAEEHELLRRAVGLIQLDTPRPSQLGPLAQALTDWDLAISRQQQQEPGLLARSVGLTPAGDLSRTWRDFVEQPDRKAIARTLERLIERHPLTPQMATVAAELMLSGPRLTGQQIRQLQAALGAAFSDLQALDQMVQAQLGERLSAITHADSLHGAIAELITWAAAEGRIEDLVLAMVRQRPGDGELRLLAEQLGLLVTTNVRNMFHDSELWRAHISQAVAAVCRIELQGKLAGTGFLIGPDLVMTCFHVLQHLPDRQKLRPDDLILRFDLRRTADGTRISHGLTYVLADYWLAASSPPEEFDYALLRIAGRPGEDPANSLVEGPRGWLHPARGYAFAPKAPLFLLQQAQGELLKITFGEVIRVSSDGRRLVYGVDTEPGADGAPCFNQDWGLVALHSSQGAEGAEGIAIDTIIVDLEAHGVQLF